MDRRIEAVSVNHNTSAYMELMLRSLFATHPPGPPLAVTIFDNASTDDRRGLEAFAAQMDVPIIQSGWTTESRNNSHGEVLRRFVLDRPGCTHFLFLDADVCFVQPSTIGVMLDELDRAESAFGIGARMSWDGVDEIPARVRDDNPDVYSGRLHPCCALIPNTPLFRRVVETIGLSCVQYLWADRDEYLDTFTLMTRVLATHGLRHVRSSAMVLHFFCVSYEWDSAEIRAAKQQRRDALLQGYRSGAALEQPEVSAP